MKRTDLFLNLFAAAAFLALGFTAGYVYHTKQSIERASEVLQTKSRIDNIDLIYITMGEQLK